MENKALLDYSKLGEGTEAVKPNSMAVSDFHFLLLIRDKVKVSQKKTKKEKIFVQNLTLLTYCNHD